jgi:hypothetical protein
VKQGLLLALLVASLGLVVPGGSGAASGPSYEEAPAPIYAPAPPLRKPRLHFAGFRRNLRSGTAILYVVVPAPGRVLLHGRGIRRLGRVAARERQRVRLVVRPKVRLMHYLKRHRKGVIRARVTFRPDDEGVPQTIERPIALKRRHDRRH